jgi:hypothetical protein
MNSFSFSLKQANREKVKTRQDQKTEFCPTVDCRELLTIPNRMIRKDSQNFLKPFQRKHKKSLKDKQIDVKPRLKTVTIETGTRSRKPMISMTSIREEVDCLFFKNKFLT